MTAKAFIATLREIIETQIYTDKIMTQTKERMNLRVGAFEEVLDILDHMEKYYLKEEQK